MYQETSKRIYHRTSEGLWSDLSNESSAVQFSRLEAIRLSKIFESFNGNCHFVASDSLLPTWFANIICERVGQEPMDAAS